VIHANQRSLDKTTPVIFLGLVPIASPLCNLNLFIHRSSQTPNTIYVVINDSILFLTMHGFFQVYHFTLTSIPSLLAVYFTKCTRFTRCSPVRCVPNKKRTPYSTTKWGKNKIKEKERFYASFIAEKKLRKTSF
jgi:hypothetical protein